MSPQTTNEDTHYFKGISLQNNIVTFTGPPDSGKSNLVKYMLRVDPYSRHLVYDPLFGYDDNTLNVIRPPDRSTKWRRYEDGNPALNQAVDEFVLVDKERRAHYFIIDEAGRLVPNRKDEGSAMGELNDFNAHYGISVWLIAQRHTQMNSDFENKATHHFVMGYKGRSDRKNLRELHADAPDLLDKAKREMGSYAFIYVGPDNTLKAFPPVKEVGQKAGL